LLAIQQSRKDAKGMEKAISQCNETFILMLTPLRQMNKKIYVNQDLLGRALGKLLKMPLFPLGLLEMNKNV